MNREEIAQLSFDCVLPSAIFFNDNLEPNCIKLYAIVRNLTKMHGYCYATNEYLASLMDGNISSIKRWLSSLKQEGYLEIEVDKEGIHWQRKIYLSDKFKKCLRKLNSELPPAQNSAPPSSKLAPIIDKSIRKEEYSKERERTRDEQPKFEFENVKFPQKRYEDLKVKYGSEVLQDTIEELNLYSKSHPDKFKVYSDHSAVIETWIKRELKKQKTGTQASWNKPKYAPMKSELNRPGMPKVSMLAPDILEQLSKK